MSAMLQLCFFFLIPYVLCEPVPRYESCTLCGPECEPSCGLRTFKTCCFNYNKKRSPVPPIPPQGSPLRSKFPWLSTFSDGTSSPRSSDQDVQVQLLLSPDWLSSDSLNHYRDLNANYQDNQLIRRLMGLTDIQPTEGPVVSNDSADTFVERNSAGTTTNDKGHAENQRHHWNSRHQRQHSIYPWSESNRRLPM